MNRTINSKAVKIVTLVPVAFMLLWAIGIGEWYIWGKNNPSFWVEVHNHLLLNAFINGTLTLFGLAGVTLLLVLGIFGVICLFNWVFPKVDKTKN